LIKVNNKIESYISFEMSFDKLKSIFSRTLNTSDEDSILSQASNFISSSRKSLPENSISEFESYLQGLPT
jgi:hypothetical protein